ncbi:MAG: cupin domain-containing protein [Thermodesulfovibrionales bacterium]
MKLVRLDEVPLSPVSHDPGLMKKVLFGPGALPHLDAVSHIEFRAGDRASAHRHEDGHEVLFCVRGKMEVVVDGNPVTLSEGGCLVVEPGEAHSIERAEEGSRLFYFRVRG